MKRSLRSWLWRVPLDQEVEEEIALHIELRTRELVAQGIEAKTAREMVLSRLGDVRRLKRTCIDIGGSRAGLVAGAMNFAGQLGAFFLAIAFGNIVDSTGDYNMPLYFIAIVLFFSSLLWLRINPEQRLQD